MKTTAPRLIALAALAGLTLTGCSGLKDFRYMITGPVSVTATEITPYNGCTIAEDHQRPDGNPATAPESLLIICGDRELVILDGRFMHKTANDFDVEATGVKQVILVNDEARIWHSFRGEDCLTIQDLDALDAKRDTCGPTT